MESYFEFNVLLLLLLFLESPYTEHNILSFKLGYL